MLLRLLLRLEWAHRMTLEEQRGRMLAEVIRAVLMKPGLGLTREQQAHGVLTAARELRALEADS